MRRSLLLLFLMVVPVPLAAVDSLVMVTPRSPWTLRELESMGVDLVSYDPETGEVYLTVDEEETQRLVDAGFSVSTVRWDLESDWQTLLDVPHLGRYHTVEETVAELESLAAAVPELTALEVIGHSLEGRPIYALKISDDPRFDDPEEADVLIVGNHHAREVMSVEVPLHFARTLLERSTRSLRLRQLINERELWIVPLLNPDGHVFQEETQGRPGWRKNRRVVDGDTLGVDLNRNYSYRWGEDDEGSSPDPLSETYRGGFPFSEPECRALRSLVERQDFRIALSYHSFGGLVLYPWGHTRQFTTPDQRLFEALADSMVRTNGYRPGNAWSGAIYLTNGVWDDYMYGETGGAKSTQTFPFTVELNTNLEGGFWPPDELIDPTCEAMFDLNLFVLRVAAAVEATLPPPPPVLAARQDAEQPNRIDLSWRVPGDGANRIVAYEVFEIDPVGAAADWRQAKPCTLRGSGRAILAQSCIVPADGRISLVVEGEMEPLWEHAYVEVRPGGSQTWQVLQPQGAGKSSHSGAALTGRWKARRQCWDGSPWSGQPVDLALRLEAHADAPETAWIVAKVDVPDMLDESRRILAVVQDTTYTVWAEKAGLFAYGVTAVDAEGQRSESELFWFVIPTPLAASVADLQFHAVGSEASLQGRSLGPGRVHFEAWCRPLAPTATAAAAATEWSSGAYRRVASTEVVGGSEWSLDWKMGPGRTAVLLRGDDGTGPRLWGPWVASVASRLRLYRAVPNPFNPSTRLRFETDRDGPVRLEIVRPDGKRVCILRDAVLPAGVHEAHWDGRDTAGSSVASGIYLARLVAASQSFTTRLILLR